MYLMEMRSTHEACLLTPLLKSAGVMQKYLMEMDIMDVIHGNHLQFRLKNSFHGAEIVDGNAPSSFFCQFMANRNVFMVFLPKYNTTTDV